jgi:hypothetical protein
MEEYRMRMFGNTVLRRTFGPNKYEVVRSLRNMRNEELLNLYSSPNIIRMFKLRRMRWAGHLARMGQKRNMHINF